MSHKIDTDPEKIEEILTRGVAQIYNKDELREKLLSGKQLHLKLGTDVTGPLITLGHSVVQRIMRDFQELGHRVTLIIGDFTTLVGDHSDKVDMRSETNEEEIKKNEENYKEQFFKTVMKEGTEIRHNSEWLKPLNFNDVIHLSKQFTVSQMLDREAFRKRFDENKPIPLDEWLYPLMQGYDSVALNCDVEFGGTDQTFNVLAGRKLMEVYGQVPQSCVVMRLLTGNDGRPMGKSLKNYIPVMDGPTDMYGKLMSIVDEIIFEYFELVTRVPMSEIREMQEAVKSGANPMDFKKRLAREVVTFYHGEEAAIEAEREFERRVQNKDFTAIEEVVNIGTPKNVVDLMMELNFAGSKSEARRLIEQGAVKINERLVSTPNDIIAEAGIFKSGKRNIVKLQIDDITPDEALRKDIIIDSEIFGKFPTFRRGLVIVKDIKNEVSNPTIENLLKGIISERQNQGLENHEYVKAWEDAHTEFGSNPNRFPPSIKSLLKRIDKDGFPFINSVVALFNYISLKHFVPCGGDDANAISGNLKLGFATGEEHFQGLGSSENEAPEPGEVIYFDDKSLNVMCRRWNWRNSATTAITTKTDRIVINIDGIGPVPTEVLLAARDELAELLTKECGAKVETAFLDKDNPTYEF